MAAGITGEMKMNITERLVDIVEKQNELIADMNERLGDMESQIKALNNVVNLQGERKLKLFEKFEFLKREFKDEEDGRYDVCKQLREVQEQVKEANNLSNQALYYVPKTSEAMEEIIYNKISGSIKTRVDDAVKMQVEFMKFKIAKAIKEIK